MLLAGVSVVAVVAAACADAPTGSEPFSLSFDRLPFPAVVVGDTLRDSSGTAVPLSARVFGGDGEVIADAPVTFLVVDRGAHLLDGGYIFGDSAGPTVRVVAEAGGIPSQPLDLAVVRPPDSLALVTTAPDTARFSPRAFISPEDVSGEIEVRVLHRPATGDPVGVASWVVRFDVELYDGAAVVPNDSLAFPISQGTRPGVLDTTDTRGVASRRILLNGARSAIDAVDSAVVSVTVLGRPTGSVSPATVRVAVPVRSR
ncbi:MAG TPA: hypothetical protein VGE02_08400 [Gemmatimonadales bacterium]